MERDRLRSGRSVRIGRSISLVRKRIDRMDRRIIALLARRYRAVVEVGKVKRQIGLPVEDPRREEEITSRIDGFGLSEGASRYVKAIYKAIFQSSYGAEGEE